MVPKWWRRADAGSAPRTRSRGAPTSSNGASSFHLGWGAFDAADAISVTFEVLEPPQVPRLYFWAMQADMAGSGGRAGGAHLGLQWHPQHPGSTAVNWGGYRSSGGELHGSGSALQSATGNPNTRDYAWTDATPYRLRIERVPAANVPGGLSAWRGSVQDMSSGALTVVRELFMAGDRIVGATMWSEVFARCDDPTVTVRWSAPVVHLADRDLEVGALSVNYQTHLDGGCANTDSSVDDVGAVQRTAVPRATPQGARLRLPPC